MDLTSKVKNVSLVRKRSSRTGNEYTQFEVEFTSGYKYSTFLNSEQLYILSNLK